MGLFVSEHTLTLKNIRTKQNCSVNGSIYIGNDVTHTVEKFSTYLMANMFKLVFTKYVIVVFDDVFNNVFAFNAITFSFI